MATREAALTGRFSITAGMVVVAANAAVVATIATTRGGGSVLVAVLLVGPIAGLAAYAIWARPQRGLLLLAALLPFHGLQPILGFPAAWKEGLVALTLAASLVAPARSRGQVGRRLPDWAFPAGALAVLGIVSVAFVGSTRGLAGLKVGFFFMLVAVVAWRCPLDRRERDRLVSILMTTGFVTAAFGIVQQLLGAERLAELGYEYNTTIRFAGGFLRSFSTFNVNFPFALFLMVVVLVALPTALEDTARLRNRLFLFSLPVIAAALVCTVTRGPWLGLAVGLTYLGATRYRVVLVGTLHLLVIGVVALVLMGSYTSAFLSASSTEERFDLWRQNLGEIAAHPLGAGVGTTGSAAERTAEREGVEAEEIETFQPDNSYFKVTLEQGVLGLWLFILLLVTVFMGTHAAAQGLSGPDGALASGTAALIVAAAAVSLVATFFEVFPIDVYFWLLVGVVAACVAESR